MTTNDTFKLADLDTYTDRGDGYFVLGEGDGFLYTYGVGELAQNTDGFWLLYNIAQLIETSSFQHFVAKEDGRSVTSYWWRVSQGPSLEAALPNGEPVLTCWLDTGNRKLHEFWTKVTIVTELQTDDRWNGSWVFHLPSEK